MQPRNQHSEAVDALLVQNVEESCSSQDFVDKRAALAVSGTSIALAGCGGGGSSSSTSIAGSTANMPQPSPSPSSDTSQEPVQTLLTPESVKAARFLLRATFTASEAEIAAVETEGPSAWLRRHQRQPNDQSARDFFHLNGYDEPDNRLLFQSDRLVNEMIWDQLLRGGNSVRKRIAFALSQFFVVSSSPRLRMPWPSQAIGAFWDILNEGAFGNFRDLLEDVALSPAMGQFLDTIGNAKADPSTGRMPDENFAREVMQLFSIGLFELNIDGSTKLNRNQPIETYSNEDVMGLAKVFTGYNIDVSGLELFPNPANTNMMLPPVEAIRRPLTADTRKWQRPSSESQHSPEEKRFLGISIPAGAGPEESLKIALDRLFEHPNVAPFFAKQMIQRLVTSNPSAAYVRRVAEVFENNGQGVRGDLAATFEAIFLDEEAQSDATISDMRFGKVREPIVRFVQFARTFDLLSEQSLAITRDLTSELGQSPFRARSVFNFFSPTYAPPRSVAVANDLVAPEFQIADETTVASWVNFIVDTISGRGFWLNGAQPDFEAIMSLADNPDELVANLNLRMSAGQLRTATIETIVSALQSVSETSDSWQVQRVNIALALVLCSNDYLVQK